MHVSLRSWATAGNDRACWVFHYPDISPASAGPAGGPSLSSQLTGHCVQTAERAQVGPRLFNYVQKHSAGATTTREWIQGASQSLLTDDVTGAFVGLDRTSFIWCLPPIVAIHFINFPHFRQLPKMITLIQGYSHFNCITTLDFRFKKSALF